MRKNIFPAVACISFIILYLLGRPVLVSRISAEELEFFTLFIDALFAVFLLSLVLAVSRLHIAAAAAVLVFFVLHRIVSMEMIIALSTVPHLWDIRFARGDFLEGSALSLSFPFYLLFLAVSGAAAVSALRKIRGYPKMLPLSLAVSCCALLAVVLLTPPAADWQSTDLSYLSLYNTVRLSRLSGAETVRKEGESSITEKESTPGMFTFSNELPAYFEKEEDEKRNVLLIVLEGISGAYIRQVQQYMGAESPFLMEKLSLALEEALIVPNFLTHSRQTIRGMYSMLSGDYSRLTSASPKAYDYITLPKESRPVLLPEVLRREGYRTRYLQSADLEYMSKDRFMPAAGYQEVLGKSFFDYSYADSGWGPDDKAYLEQSLSYIKELDADDSEPWFLTLLTSGTHHPYTIPEDFAEDYSSDPVASAAYLDEALGAFFGKLDEEGITEDTLVIITSDESHGVAGHPHGRFWGLLAVLAPEGRLVINEDVFGLLDLPASILDYLGIEKIPYYFSSHSFMRPGTGERELLFGSFYTERKGLFYKQGGKDSLVEYRVQGGEMFGPSYERQGVREEETHERVKKIGALRDRVFHVIGAESQGPMKYLLLEDNKYELNGSGKTLTSGQYLHLPGDSTVTVTLEARSIHGAVQLYSQILQPSGEMEVPSVDIPVIPSGGELRLRFRFPVKEKASRVWAVLTARPAEKDEKDSEVEIHEFSLQISEGTAADSLEVMEMELLERE